MRKILIGVLIALLLLFNCMVIFNGFQIGPLKILGINQIKAEDERLTQEIAQVELLMKNTYPARTKQLESSVSRMKTAKNDYLDIASVSTDKEIKAANQTEEYTIEFLFAAIGGHAKEKGVKVEYQLVSNSEEDTSLKNINFTVNGGYSAIVEFLESLEDDTTLNFRIRNFKLVPSGENLCATFIVNNVRVKEELETITEDENAEDEENPENGENTEEGENQAEEQETNDEQNTNNTQNTKSKGEIQNMVANGYFGS